MELKRLLAELDRQYDMLGARLPGFVPREGQRQMIREIAGTLAEASFDPDEAAAARVAVVEGGTGVGKTRAYLLAGLQIARARKVKLLVSTATVALQEQLLNKDLPELARGLEGGINFAMLKGRSRYACPMKIAGVASSQQGSLGLEVEEDDGPRHSPADASRCMDLLQRLSAGTWDGERDSLPADAQHGWSDIAADRSSCPGKACAHFRRCPYFDAKRRAVSADVIVANHDLVLASMRADSGALPSGERAVYVFDEGHHLPRIAIAQGASECALTGTGWITKLVRHLASAAGTMGYPAGALPTDLGLLRQRLADLARVVIEAHAGPALANADTREARVRMPGGQQPAAIAEMWREVGKVARACATPLDEMLHWLKEKRSEEPEHAAAINKIQAALGPGAARLDELVQTAELMLEQSDPPPARWYEFRRDTGAIYVDAKACPIFAGEILDRLLWSRLRAAVVTSATLRTLGRFDFFLRESGLSEVPHTRTAAVPSPFDYEAQGRFVVVATDASPKDAASHTQECARLIADDLAHVEHGALVLCSSWQQLRSIVAAQPPEIAADLLVQSSASRDELLRRHRQAVGAGRRSVLVGLQSFGEGLDLPGELCEWVLMPKTPFSSPSDPVSEARAEWLEAKGRNSFQELVVPATGVTLNQWVGRGIRSERDKATCVCYDPRLVGTGFGRQLVAGLPNFRKLHRKGGVERPIGSPRERQPDGASSPTQRDRTN